MTVEITVEIAIAIAGILVTVLGVFGTLIKINYDQAKQLDHLLRGVNGADGFIEESADSQASLETDTEDIERVLRAHTAVQQELVYVLNDVAETLDEEDLENVDTRRLNYLEEALRAHDDFDVGGSGSDDSSSESDLSTDSAAFFE